MQMFGRELDEIVRELYVLPPSDFVAARNELVRQARAAGSRELAEQLQHLRRPTRSAWLVNLLARDSAAMQGLSTLGRELRDAQTGLDRTELRHLAERRRNLIADLLNQARVHAAELGIRLTPTQLSEVEATLQAALVDLAGAMTIRNGRLVRPLSHSGFGPRPRSAVSGAQSATERRPVEVPTAAAADLERPRVEDELAARRQARGGGWVVELLAVPDPRPDVDRSVAVSDTAPQSLRDLRQAEEDLAAAEAGHWQSEFELADAEGAVEAVEDRVSSLDTMRMEARRDKVTAQRHLAEAVSRQREAVKALADARRRLDAARRRAETDE
jgi:hypothetical protein